MALGLAGMAGSLSCIYSRPAQEPITEPADQTAVENQTVEKNKKNKDNPESEEKRTEGYNYCQINDHSDPVSRYLAGEEVPTEKVFEGDLEKLKTLEFEPIGSAEGYEILLVPVGYESFQPEQLIINLKNIFKGLNIDFYSLDRSVPVTIKRVERYAFHTKAEEAKIIKEKTSADKLVFVLNVEEYLGSGGNSIVISGNSDSTLYLAAHETGHGLGLGDGYERYYKTLNHSELFTSIRELEPRVLKAYGKIHPPINDTGSHCNGRKVFTFYDPDSDIMDKGYRDKTLISRIESGPQLFNPLQVEIMKNYVADRITAQKMIGECIPDKIDNACYFFVAEPPADHLLVQELWQNKLQ